jgi:hypothetical protein
VCPRHDTVIDYSIFHGDEAETLVKPARCASTGLFTVSMPFSPGAPCIRPSPRFFPAAPTIVTMSVFPCLCVSRSSMVAERAAFHELPAAMVRLGDLSPPSCNAVTRACECVCARACVCVYPPSCKGETHADEAEQEPNNGLSNNNEKLPSSSPRLHSSSTSFAPFALNKPSYSPTTWPCCGGVGGFVQGMLLSTMCSPYAYASIDNVVALCFYRRTC